MIKLIIASLCLLMLTGCSLPESMVIELENFSFSGSWDGKIKLFDHDDVLPYYNTSDVWVPINNSVESVLVSDNETVLKIDLLNESEIKNE